MIEEGEEPSVLRLVQQLSLSQYLRLLKEHVSRFLQLVWIELQQKVLNLIDNLCLTLIGCVLRELID